MNDFLSHHLPPPSKSRSLCCIPGIGNIRPAGHIRDTPLSCQLITPLLGNLTGICHDFSELNCTLVTWNFSINNSILVWSVKPSIGVPSLPIDKQRQVKPPLETITCWGPSFSPGFSTFHPAYCWFIVGGSRWWLNNLASLPPMWKTQMEFRVWIWSSPRCSGYWEINHWMQDLSFYLSNKINAKICLLNETFRKWLELGEIKKVENVHGWG